MFCPKCGQAKTSESSSFCSRCGTPLVGVAELAANRGSLFVMSGSPELSPLTPRKNGLKQSFYIFFLALLSIPIFTIIVIASDSTISQIAIVPVFLAVCAFLRVIFALVFQSDTPTVHRPDIARAESIEDLRNLNILPSQKTSSASDWAAPSGANQYATTELTERPASVTEGTTSLLDKDQT